MQEEDVLTAVHRDLLMEHVREIAQHVRLSGSEEEALAFDYIESKLKSWGIQYQRATHPAYISLPGEASLVVRRDGRSQGVACITHSMAQSTGEGGVSGCVTDVGPGRESDYEHFPAGAIALVDGLASPDSMRRAVRAGAVGAIFNNGRELHEMIVSPVWGSPSSEDIGLLPQIPAVSIHGSDAANLRIELSGGPVSVTITAKVLTEWREIPLLVADIPGVLFPDEVVMLAGHVDSWHYGAMDNGSANAVSLEMLRLFQERRGELKRTLRVAFWSGHSHGRYAGSTWYVDEHWQELNEQLVAQLYVDSVGGKGATVLAEAWAMAETRQIASATVQAETGETFHGGRFGRAGDQSFYGIGVSGLFMCLSEQPPVVDRSASLSSQFLGGGKTGGLGWWWHTVDDTTDKLDPEYLERDARVYAAALRMLLTESRLPLDFRETAREIYGHLTEWQAVAEDRFSLQSAIELCRELESKVDTFYASHVEDGMFNRKLMALQRLLIPMNYSTGNRFEQDLALNYPPIPALAPIQQLVLTDTGSTESKHLEVLLQRRLNYITHTLKEALLVLN